MIAIYIWIAVTVTVFVWRARYVYRTGVCCLDSDGGSPGSRSARKGNPASALADSLMVALFWPFWLAAHPILWMWRGLLWLCRRTLFAGIKSEEPQ